MQTNFTRNKQKKHYFCLALILTHRLYPNAGTPPAASTEPTVSQVMSFDYWQSVHCRINCIPGIKLRRTNGWTVIYFVLHKRKKRSHSPAQ